MPVSPEMSEAAVATQVPFHFRCPISLELMRDPVTVASGQTYDRPSIESWIAAGNRTCPVTRSPLPELSLIPNHTLRRLILRWCAADPAAVASLVLQADSPSTPEPARIDALRRLRSAADARAAISSCPDHRAVILSLSFREPDAVAVESLAVAAAALPPLSEQESAAVAASSDRLFRLTALLTSHSSPETRAAAAALVEAAAAGTKSPELRVSMGKAPGLLEALVRILLDNDDVVNSRAVKAAIRALFSLCLVKPNREKAAALRAADAIIEKVVSGELERGDIERGLAAVELLCRVETARESLAAHDGAVAALVKVMAANVSDRAAEHAAGTLAALCGASDAARREAVERGVMGRLLLMVQSDCTERGKRKAQTLLKMLHAAWPACDSLAITDDFLVPPSAAAVAAAASLNFLY